MTYKFWEMLTNASEKCLRTKTYFLPKNFELCAKFRGVQSKPDWRYFCGSESCGDFFSGLRPLTDSVCARTFCICARCLSPHKCRIHAHKQIEPAQMQGWRAQTAILVHLCWYRFYYTMGTVKKFGMIIYLMLDVRTSYMLIDGGTWHQRSDN